MKSYNSVSAFQRACLQSSNAKNNFLAICDLYKKILDSNFSNRFCLGNHCKLMFMVEIKYDDSKWGATPKMFSTKDEAEKEAAALKIKYPFIRECRIITRKLEETGRKEGRKEGINPKQINSRDLTIHLYRPSIHRTAHLIA